MKCSLLTVIGLVVLACLATGQLCLPPATPSANGDTTSPGAVLYSANNCGFCHGATGGGLVAPSILGESAEELRNVLVEQQVTHAGGKFPDLTDQNLADLAEFLGS